MDPEKPTFDEIPIGIAKNNTMLEEYPPDYNPNNFEEEKIQQPLPTRLKSKLWKVRQQAYEQLIDLLETGTPDSESFFSELSSSDLVNYINDNNPASQEKGLQAILIWLEKQPNVHSVLDVKEIVRSLIEKALISAKLLTKQTANSIILILFERGCKPSIQEAIFLNLTQKNPKIVCSSIVLIVELLTQFGVRKLDMLKPYLPEMEKLSQSQQGTIRTEVMNFYKEASKWLGKALLQFIANLKKQQQEEIEKFLQSLPDDHQMKALRCNDETSGNDSQEIEAYDLAEAVEVFSKFSESWCEKLLQLAKWQERKEQLEVLQRAVNTPKIAPAGQLAYPVTQMLKKLLNDKNIVVSNLALRVIGLIASGLRKHYSQYAKMVLEPVLQKLKDKKPQVLEESFITINKMFHCLNLDDMFEDLKSLLEDKSGDTKKNVLQVFEKYVDINTKQQLLRLNSIKQLPNLTKKYLDDSSQEVREKSLCLLAKLQGKVYEGALKLNDIKPEKFQRINVLAQSINDQKPPAIQPVQQPIASKASVPPQTQIQVTTTQMQPLQIPSTSFTQPPNQQPTKIVYNEEAMTGEQCEQAIRSISDSGECSLFTKQFLDLMERSKHDALILITKNQISSVSAKNAEILLKYVKFKSKNFKDLNLNLNRELMNFLLWLSNHPQLPTRLLQHFTQFIIEKIQDNKFTTQCHQLMVQLSQFHSPQHLSSLISSFEPQKAANPKQITEILSLISKHLNSKAVPLPQIITLIRLAVPINELLARKVVDQLRDLVDEDQIPEDLKADPPFPTNTISDKHIEKLKKKILSLQTLPQSLIEDLFSLNQQSNVKAARQLRTKINKSSLLSELIIQWVFVVGFLRESVILQSELLQLLAFAIENYILKEQDINILSGYIRMLCFLFVKNHMPILAQRSMSLMMSILHCCKRVKSQIRAWMATAEYIQEDDDSVALNQKALSYMTILVEKSSEWQDMDPQLQRVHVTRLLGELDEEGRAIEVRPPPARASNQLQVNETTGECKVLERKIEEMSMQAKKMLQDKGGQPWEKILMEMMDVAEKVILQKDSDQICTHLNTIQLLFSEARLVEQLGYKTYYSVVRFSFQNMIKKQENEDPSNRQQQYHYQQNRVKRSLNSIMLKALGQADPTNMYLSLMDIILEVRQENQSVTLIPAIQLVTRCLSKLISPRSGRMAVSSLVIILERFNQYLSRYCCDTMNQYNEETKKADMILSKSLQTTLQQFLNEQGEQQLVSILKQLNLPGTSHLVRWTETLILESKHDQQNKSRLENIVDLFKKESKFEQALELLVTLLKSNRQLNWKAYIPEGHPRYFDILNGVEASQLELNQSALEKKVGQLETMSHILNS